MVKKDINERILSTNYLVKTIKDGQKNGERFCFILGAGASVSSKIATGAQLEYKWMEEMNNDPGMYEVSKTAKRIAKHLDHSFDEILKVWQEAKQNKQTTLPSEYYFDIYTLRFHPNHRNGYHYLENLMERTQPSFGYHVLSLLLAEDNGSNLVITTNFDTLVEDSLFLYTNKKPLVINHELLAEFAGDLNFKRPVVAKIHRGLFFDPLNRPEEIKKLQGRWKEVLKKVFQNYTPVVIGYGGGDGSLMGVLQDESVIMKNGIYWCYIEKYGLPGDNVQEIINNKNVFLVQTAGFDAIMLAIGKTLFEDKVDPAIVEKNLKNKINLQIETYGKQYDKLIAEEKENKTNLSESEIEFGKNLKELSDYIEQSEIKREKDNQMTSGDYIRSGNRYYDKKDYQKALESYNRAIELDQNNAIAYYNRGIVYGKQREYEKAIEDYSRAIDLDENCVNAYNNQGSAYGEQGEYDKAVADYSRAIELDKNYKNAYYGRGIVYGKQGEYDKAIADYSKVIELDENYAYAYNNRGNVYDEQGEYDKAIADYSKAIDLDENNAVAYNNRGYTFVRQGEYEKAIADYSKAIELDENYKYAYLNRANVYRFLGENEKALEDEKMAEKCK